MATMTIYLLLLHFLSYWTISTATSRAIGIQFTNNDNDADNNPPTPTKASKWDTQKADSTASQAWGPRDGAGGGGNGAPSISITSLFPPDNARLDASYQQQLTLSFQIKALNIKAIRAYFGLIGDETGRTMTRVTAGSYSLALSNIPSGTYSWRFEVTIDNGGTNGIVKKSYGPWGFTIQEATAAPQRGSTIAPAGPSNSTDVTPGLQSDCLVVDSINYNICLDLKSVSGKYEPWMADFGAAKRRWESILKDDGQSAVNLDPHWKVGREWIATSLPPLVDDLYISGFLEPYDGEGGVLGMAGPYFMRTDPQGYKRPIAGYMLFDTADQDWLREQGIWTNTIIHEMGHVLGLGTMWRQNGLHSGSVNDDRYKTNSYAEAAWEQLCPGGRLPIETLDVAEGIDYGTAGGHWDEACLVNELMTGFVSQEMPLSNITIASLADMGYTVDYSKADPYGRADLGDCGDYCPDLAPKRGLRGSTQQKLRFRREVSPNGHKKILQAAAKHMHKLRSAKPASLPSNLEYHAGDRLTVYILDEDGDIKDETVSWEQAKQYASDTD